MKTNFTLISVLVALAAAPVWAGPDPHFYDAARKHPTDRIYVSAARGKTEQSAAKASCPARWLLPDRSARAQAQVMSPWGRLRMSQYEEWVAACKRAA